MIGRNLLTALLCFASLSVNVVNAAELSQYTAIRVQKANQLAQDEQFSAAIEALQKIDTSKAYDQAFVARMLGVFYWQNNQIKPAIKQLTLAVNSNKLEDEQGWVTEKMLADLLLSDQQFSQALPHYYQLVKQVPATQKEDQIWLRIAQAHYQVEEWKAVIPAVDKYRRFQAKDELQPLSLKLGAQLQLKRWNDAIPTLERLVTLQPDKVNWWRQLVSLQLQQGQNKQALSTLALAKGQGVALSQQDRILLAQLYAQRGIPERGAMELAQLDGATTDLDLIVSQASYWQQAREWQQATKQWQLAAKLDGKYHWNVAQLMVQEGQYQQALTVLDRVQGRKADVALAKTRAHYKLNQFEQALIQAKQANNIEPSKQSQSWIKYLTQLRRANQAAAS
ncbi:hypothetical protein VII00023_03053 [Vibrio ichthyoenteri ATCC 700023]|uniref:TPR domain protein component of TonB system n=1 Tax=Vibrio ichthyoenteri ATCC 700023 TaxID=870968 RepID=F9RYH9_9VIBR|nr:tetratricopeptide repeat protein [Vibrio ichthyoenteri]EGU46396.1 hypothetical protein VII00023_03053 [Vibrio ichthyoenteri ATCC 700023]